MKTIIGLIMTYNEIDFIEMWLKNVEYMVDKILIMDGGSTDGTIAIINKYIEDRRYKTPIELIIDPQKGENYNDQEYNHRERRNKLIKLAAGKSDYIFQMDVDESIKIIDADILRELIIRDRLVYTFPRKDFCFHPHYYRKRCNSRVPWLYKNNVGIEYIDDDPPHEPLGYKGKNLMSLSKEYKEDTDILIYHWHYCYGRKAMRDYQIPNWKRFLVSRKWAIEHKEEEGLVKYDNIPFDYYIYCERPPQTIQAVTMVYNEVDFIEMWLNNISKFVDSILIMDGGSTDGTLDKVREWRSYSDIKIDFFIDKQSGEDYNDKTFDHAGRWNRLIDMATGDYILQIMCDAIFPEDDPELLHNLILLEKWVYVFKCYNFWYSPYIYKSVNRVPRLFKKGLGIKYGTENPPHEATQLNGVNLLEVKNRLETDIPVYHYHYCHGRKCYRDTDAQNIDELIKKRNFVEKNYVDIGWKKLDYTLPESYRRYCEKNT